MGVFNDFRSVTRDGWKYEYRAVELIQPAIDRLQHYTASELQAREAIAKLLGDPNVRSSDERIERLRADIEAFGDLKEKCTVWVHEFQRVPDRVYSLSLGDVTFFELVGRLPVLKQSIGVCDLGG